MFKTDFTSHYNATDYRKHSAPQTQRGLALVELAQVEDGDEVLDVGCGDGRTTLNLFNSNRKLERIVGVDLSADQIKAAKLLSKKPENAEFAEKSEFLSENFLTDNTLTDESFTLAFSNTAIHWMGSVAYRKIFKLLKHGGRMCVEQCAKGDLQELHDACLDVVDEMGFSSQFDGWRIEEKGYWTPTEDEMIALLENIGFSEVNVSLDAFEFPSDFSDEGIYEAFLASSLHNYYDVISDEHRCREFKERVRKEFQQSKPTANAKRIRVTATKN